MQFGDMDQESKKRSCLLSHNSITGNLYEENISWVYGETTGNNFKS